MTMRERLQNYQQNKRQPALEPQDRKIMLRIPPALHERMKACKRRDDVSVNRLAILAIERALTELEQPQVPEQAEPGNG